METERGRFRFFDGNGAAANYILVGEGEDRKTNLLVWGDDWGLYLEWIGRCGDKWVGDCLGVAPKVAQKYRNFTGVREGLRSRGVKQFKHEELLPPFKVLTVEGVVVLGGPGQGGGLDSVKIGVLKGDPLERNRHRVSS